MKIPVLGQFNIPASFDQWAKGAFWAVLFAASSVPMNGDTFDWRKAAALAFGAFVAYCHNSAAKEGAK